MKKKIMALLTGVLMLVCCVIPAMEKEKTTEAVDENYDRMVGEIMRGYEADPEGTKSALEELDTVLVSEPIVTEYRVPNTSKGARINSPLTYIVRREAIHPIIIYNGDWNAVLRRVTLVPSTM